MTDLSLLIVEDDQTQIDSYNFNIEDFNEENDHSITVTTATNFEAAQKLIDEHDFDSAVIDLKLDTQSPDKFAGLELISSSQ